MVDRRDELERLNARFDELWPILRSITGPGFRESLDVLREDVPLETGSVPSGTRVFDWEVPKEWRIREARLTGPDGEVYADLAETNLAVVNYSHSVDEHLSREELEDHLYTLSESPEARPYVTSYYERNWGFCLPHSVYDSLPPGEYHAYIDSEFVDGELTYGHTLLKGESEREFLLSTYLCHPSLANNELSGPLVLTSLYERLSKWDRRKYTYRFVVVPETIGSLAYLSDYGGELRENLVGGLVLTCLGGPEDTLSYKRTRREDALVDDVFRHVNNVTDQDFRFRPFDVGGSDERQYCSPGFDLPVGQIARTVYDEYDEYHTSLDTKEFMGIEPLVGSAEAIERVLRVFEYAGYYVNTNPYGEPMMSKRDLYPTVNSPGGSGWEEEHGLADDEFVLAMMRILNYCDGDQSIVEIADRYDLPVPSLAPIVDRLREVGLLEPVDHTPPYDARFEPPPTKGKDI